MRHLPTVLAAGLLFAFAAVTHADDWPQWRGPTNDGISAANSSMMAILGRMCTYSGQRITWKEAMDSELALGPKEYSWSTKPPAVVVAAPGNPKYKAF